MEEEWLKISLSYWIKILFRSCSSFSLMAALGVTKRPTLLVLGNFNIPPLFGQRPLEQCLPQSLPTEITWILFIAEILMIQSLTVSNHDMSSLQKLWFEVFNVSTIDLGSMNFSPNLATGIMQWFPHAFPKSSMVWFFALLNVPFQHCIFPRVECYDPVIIKLQKRNQDFIFKYMVFVLTS